MPVDFSALVSRPVMDTFGRSVTVDPVVSDPGGAAYEARGAFHRAYESVFVAEGVTQTATSPMLDIRLAEFTIPPAKGDHITVDGTEYQVTDFQPDGQGRADLVLKEWRA